jgi:DNA gyrase subunit A
MIVRTGMDQLRTIGRATQGVRIIALKAEDKLVATARVVAEDSAQAQLPLAAGVVQEGEQHELPIKIEEKGEEREAKGEERKAPRVNEGSDDAPNGKTKDDDAANL